MNDLALSLGLPNDATSMSATRHTESKHVTFWPIGHSHERRIAITDVGALSFDV